MNPATTTEIITSHSAEWQAAGGSHPGRVRSNNEDRFFVDAERGLFLVVDGVGGEAAGEVAAEIARDTLRSRLARRTGTPGERLREAIALANNAIFEQAQADPTRRGMSCVLTAALVENGRIYIGHVGDTRLYEVRGSRIQKLTRDHSPVGMREDAGELTEYEAMRHPRRNEIFRDVGSQLHNPDDPDFVDVGEHPTAPDAAYVLCSDGLSDLVPAATLREVVTRHAGRPDAAVSELIELANAAGGKDNITVVVGMGVAFGATPELAVGAPRTTAEALAYRSERTPNASAPHLRAASGPPSPTVRPAPRGGVLTGRAALFTYGLLSGLVLLLVAQALLTRFAPPAEPSPWRLLAVGEGAYASIGEALAAAAPGDTVVVAPGIYSEAVRLKSGVALLSRQAGAAVLRPGGPADSAVVWARGVEGGRFGGFRVEADSLPYGIYVAASDVVIEEVEVTGARRAGIVIDSSATATLRASFVQGNLGAGVWVRNGASPRLVNNWITGNGRGALRRAPGLRVDELATPLVEGNVIRENGAPPQLPSLERTGPVRQRNLLDDPPVPSRRVFPSL